MASGVEGYLEAMRNGSEYFPIPVASLRIDTITRFDLYLQVRADEPMVLYAEKDITFSDDARKRLEDNNVEYLYVKAKAETAYLGYLESNLHQILTDPDIPIGEKAEILYVSAQGLVKEILDNPEVERGIERSKAIVQNTVHMLISQQSALSHLIKTATYDYFTYTHSVNACVYGLALAQRTSMVEPAALREFGNGALLRDVGMGQIDSRIVNDPGQLSVQDYEVLKQHPILGEETLRNLGGLSKMSLDIVRHHHEKMNGTGYPDALTKNEIHPLVRICSIGDIFNALTTHRSYRRAYSSFDALKIMSTEMRDELDTDYLRVFVELMGNPG